MENMYPIEYRGEGEDRFPYFKDDGFMANSENYRRSDVDRVLNERATGLNWDMFKPQEQGYILERACKILRNHCENNDYDLCLDLALNEFFGDVYENGDEEDFAEERKAKA